MHKFKLNGKSFEEMIMCTNAHYPINSFSNKYIQRSEATDHFDKHIDIPREIKLTFLWLDLCDDPIKNQAKIENWIYTNLKNNKVEWLNLDDRYTNVVIEKIEFNDMYYGVFNVTFKSLSGKWFSEIKKVNVNTVINYNGVDESRYLIIKLTPNTEKVSVINETLGLRINVNTKSRDELLINFENKTVIQNNIHQSIDNDSRFFNLIPGNNKITVKGAKGSIEYREVLA